MSARRRPSAQAANLDSLLDTMANVTGILIVLLAVTQLSVGDAMERIRAQLAQRPELTARSLAQVEAEARALREVLAPLQDQREEFEQSLRSGRAELSALEAANREARDAAQSAAQFLGDGRTLRGALERGEREAQGLAERVDRARQGIAVLDQEIARLSRDSPREVTLPDPRPPPRGAAQLPVFVRYGRAVPVDVTELVGLLKRATRAASEGRWVYGDGPPNFVDRSQIVDYFQSHDVGTEQFRWHVVNHGGREFWAHLEWRDRDMGDDLDDLFSERSQFRAELARLDPRTHYLLFLVWEDSFEPYLVAREIATQAGFTSGWDPHGEHVPFRQWLLSTRAHVTVD